MTMAIAEISTPRLAFSIENAEVQEHAAVPTLAFELHVAAADVQVRSLSLQAQVRIQAPKRTYDEATSDRLWELFGDRRDWPRSLRSLLWAQCTVAVPAFTHASVVRLLIPCSYDFDVAATKYLHAVRDGAIPLEFLFSGSVFYEDALGLLRAARIGWDCEAQYAMPARLWFEMMDRYFPNSAWLRLRLDVFDRLLQFKMEQGLPTWEAALEALLRDQIRVSVQA